MEKKFHSFADRLTRWIIFTVLLTMTVIYMIILYIVSSAMMDETKSRYNGVITYTDGKVESVLTSVEVSAINNVDAIERALKNNKNIYDALANELKLNPHIVGCGVGFIPYYYEDKGQWFEPYAVREESGKIATRQIASEYHDYHQMEWWAEAYKAGRGRWSDPYFDADGGKTMMCTYALPIHDDQGRVVGIFGADVSLDWMTSQLKVIEDGSNTGGWLNISGNDESPKSYAFILSRKGEYIVHPESQRVLSGNFINESKHTMDVNDDLLGKEMVSGKTGSMTLDMDSVNSVVFYSPLNRSGWSMAIVVPRVMILLPAFLLATMVTIPMALGLLVVFFVCRITIRRESKPLHKLAKSADEVAKGHFDTSLPDIKHNDEIRRLRDSFEKMQISLSEYIEQLKDTTAQKASIESELNIARGIQMSMLPKTFPPYPERNDVDLYGQLVPAKAVGGDLYDFNIRDEHLFFCIGDVSGKGVPASLVMAVISALFRSLSAKEDNPMRIMKALNKSMCTRNESMMFATIFVGNLDLKTGVLQYCNGGHCSPILASSLGVGYLPCDSNLPIGVMTDAAYTLQIADINPGTTIFLYTDGLSEAENSEYAQFEDERIMKTLRATIDSKPEKIISQMKNDVRAFVGDAEQSDDLTMLAVQYYVD